jgi:hypothetical protein
MHVYANDYILTVRKLNENYEMEHLLTLPFPTQEKAYNAFDWWVSTGKRQLGATSVIVRRGDNLQMFGRCR